MLRSTPLLFAILTLAGVSQAHAQPAHDSSTAVGEVVVTGQAPSGRTFQETRVSYADLDLGTGAGGYTLLRRINAAAKQVCNPEPSTPADLSDRADYRSCLYSAVERAVYDVDEPSLVDAYHYSGG